MHVHAYQLLGHLICSAHLTPKIFVFYHTTMIVVSGTHFFGKKDVLPIARQIIEVTFSTTLP